MCGEFTGYGVKAEDGEEEVLVGVDGVLLG